ncbi:MAG: tetratricopeptide repeat protein [Candidatus Caldatribacteriota bacterium]|nr:tetratricopeptide repeat protein [Candidatus Caldatribacteriota bacterium]
MIISFNNNLIKKYFRDKGFAKIIHFTLVLLLALSSFFYIGEAIFASEKIPSIDIGISFFANKTGQSDWNWLSKGLTDRLINNLSQYDLVNCISRQDVENFYQIHQILPSQIEIKNSLLTQFSKELETEIIFFGNFYFSSPNELSLSLKKYEKATDITTAFRDFTIEKTDIFDLENILVSFILEELSIKLTANEEKIIKKPPTHSIEALTNYYKSLDYRDRAIKEYEGVDFPSKELWAKAIEYGEEAVDLDPEYAEAYYLLAEIYNKTRWTIREAKSLNHFIELVESNQLESKDIYKKAGQAYFRLGYSFYFKNNFEKAIKYFNSSIKYDPDLLEPHIYLAQLYYDINEVGLSLDECEEVLRLDPQNKEISWLLKKNEQSRKYGREAYQHYEKGYLSYKEGNYQDAINYFTQSIFYNSEYKESHYYLALTYYELEDFDNSIKQWEEAIRLDPFDNSAKHFLNRSLEEKKYGRETLKYFDIGYDYYMKGEYEKAIKEFNKSLECNSKFEKARKYLSRSYYQLNQMDKYRKEREKESELKVIGEEGKAEEHYKLGYEFYSLDDYKIAIEELNKALDLKSDFPAARYLLAECLFRQKDYKKARIEYDRVVVDSEESEYTDDALLGSGWSYYLLEKYTEAAERFSKLITDFPISNLAIQAQYKLGKAYFKIEDYDKVAETYEEFIEKYPQFQEREIEEIYYLLGQTKVLLGKYKEAEELFKKIILLYPGFEMTSQVKYYKVLSLFKQERYEEAIVDLQELISGQDEENKQTGEIQYLLARCYLNLGEYSKSIRDMENLKQSEEEKLLLEKVSFDLGLAYSQKGDKEKAILEFREFIEEYPQSKLIKPAHFELGKNLFDLEKYKLAIEELKEISTIDALYLKGKAAEELGNYEEEISAFSELKEKYPKSKFSQEAFFKLGNYYYDKKMYEKAIVEFKKIIKLFPDSPFIMESYYWLGWSYFKLENYQEAKDYFKKVETEEVDLSIAQKSIFMAAEALYNIKEFSLAREEYKNYLGKYPQSKLAVNAQYAIAWTFLENKEIKASIEEFEKVVKNYPDSDYVEESEFIAAKSYLFLGKIDEAEIELGKFIDGYPKSRYKTEALYLLGKMYLEKERWMDSIIWLERLNRESPDNPYLAETLYGLCLSFFKKDEYEKAIKVGENYLEEYSDLQFTDDILYINSMCWEKLEDSEKAIKSYRKLVDKYPKSSYIKKVKERLEILVPDSE